METTFEWLSDISGLRFISIKDKAKLIKSTLEAYFKGSYCELNKRQKSELINSVESTDISVEDIVKKIAQFTASEDDSIHIDRMAREILADIDGDARAFNYTWFCEYSSLDRFHFSKSKWIDLIREHFGVKIKGYQVKPISTVNELVIFISSLESSNNKVNEQDSTHSTERMDSKQTIEQELNSITDFCQNQISQLGATKFKHPRLADLRNQYIAQLRTLLEEYLKLTNLIQNEIVWDHLVVAFFGETNAGKSTLIETLRLNYGVDDLKSWNHSEIVGDGQADYTKDATEYAITINGKRVTLIDVPGIEGDEAKYANVIETALRKAHVVFYVQGKNKKPDAKIAEKIGRYLSDWSRVYSIYNVRNSLDDYDPEQLNDLPETLKTDKNIDLQNQIQGVLSDILGNVYQGGLLLHGLVGLSVSSDFEHSVKWQNLHKQAIRLFKDSDSALEFSNIKEWISLMNDCSDNFEKVILESNRQKIAGLKTKGIRMFKDIENAQSRDIENLISRLHSLKNSVKSLFNNSIRDVKQRPVSETNRILNVLKFELVNIVNSKSDNSHKVRRAKSKAYTAKYTLNTEIESTLTDIMYKLKSNLDKHFSEFKNIMLKVPQIPDFSLNELDLDIDDAFENLEVSFADVCNTVSTVAGTAAAGAVIGSWIPGLGTMIGAGIGAVVGAVGKGLMSDGGKGETAQAIGKEIEICKESANERISMVTTHITSNLHERQLQTIKIVENEIVSVNDLSDALNIIYQKFTIR